MRYGKLKRLFMLLTLAFGLSSTARVSAQALVAPLTVEGAHQRSAPSAAVMGAGGMTLLSSDHASSMLQNPAMLTTLSGLQISIGGIYRSIDQSQVQQYAPVRYYPNLSLLLEGRTDQIPDPDPDLFGFTPADSVQRSFDDLGPNWNRTDNASAPLQGFIAAPFTTGAFKLAAGFGVVEYGDFNYHYQNNNVVSPNILSQRPLPMARPTDDNPVEVDWYQAVRSRQGAITGYGGAMAVQWERYDVSLGVSGTYLTGSTEDFERDTDRGQLTFFANYFRADSSLGSTTRSGWSDFSGFDIAVSTTISSEFVTAGLTVKPPATITRSYALNVTSGGASSNVAGEDEFKLPWRGGAGLVVRPRDNFALGLEYELRPYADARLVTAGGDEQSPWLSSSAFRIGAEYAVRPWLALRAGMRREAEPFGSAGRAIEDDPVWFTAYSAGVGAEWQGVRLNVAYEDRSTTYEDILASALYRNQDMRRVVVADITYTFNWPR